MHSLISVYSCIFHVYLYSMYRYLAAKDGDWLDRDYPKDDIPVSAIIYVVFGDILDDIW